jgi:hypothetical protein
MSIGKAIFILGLAKPAKAQWNRAHLCALVRLAPRISGRPIMGEAGLLAGCEATHLALAHAGGRHLPSLCISAGAAPLGSPIA